MYLKRTFFIYIAIFLLSVCSCSVKGKDEEVLSFKDRFGYEVYYTETDGIASKKCFVLSKYDDNLVIRTNFLSVISSLSNKKQNKKNKRLTNKEDLISGSSQMLHEFDNCLQEMSKHHTADSIKYIEFSTMDFCEYAIMYTQLLHKRLGSKINSLDLLSEEFDNIINSSNLHKKLDLILRSYGMEIDTMNAISIHHERTFVSIPKKALLELYDITKSNNTPNEIFDSPITISLRKIK